MSMVMDGLMPRSRAKDPVTSLEAGRAADLKGSQRYVFDTLTTFGPFADHELVEFYAGDESGRRYYGSWTPQRLRSARKELADAGLVEATGEVVPSEYGRPAQVWQAVVPPG